MFNSGLFPGGGNGNGVTAREKESWLASERDRCSKLRYNRCEHETVGTVYFWWDVRTVCSRKPGIFEWDEARRLASERPLFVSVKQLDILSETLGHQGNLQNQTLPCKYVHLSILLYFFFTFKLFFVYFSISLSYNILLLQHTNFPVYGTLKEFWFWF